MPSVCIFNLRTCCYQFGYLVLLACVIGAISLCYQFVYLVLPVFAIGVFLCILRGLDTLSVCGLCVWLSSEWWYQFVLSVSIFNLRTCCYQFGYLVLLVCVIGAISLCYQFAYLVLPVFAIGVLCVF